MVGTSKVAELPVGPALFAGSTPSILGKNGGGYSRKMEKNVKSQRKPEFGNNGGRFFRD
jgi:hypothetical protein